MISGNFFDIISQNQAGISATLAALFLLVIIWNVYLQLGLSGIKKRTRVFFESGEAKDLEEIIYGQIKKANEICDEMKKINADNAGITEKMKKCIQKVSIVRFNPYGEVGGNQSFAIALLDKHLSGVMILSLYSREGVRVYSKPIKEGKSEYKLSKEEEDALKLASEEK